MKATGQISRGVSLVAAVEEGLPTNEGKTRLRIHAISWEHFYTTEAALKSLLASSAAKLHIVPDVQKVVE